MIPFIFSALAIRAVGEAAMAMVEEVRRQFRTIPGIMEGTGKPEYDKCVAISTQASIKKMMLPGAIAIVSPLIIGFMPGLGAEALGGFLAGATVSGVLMGMFQNNAGGAWDNAKKSFEKGVEINGEMFYKKSEPHKASVTGDTVGDPFKDTSGPSMNILIKLMSIVSLVIAPTLAGMKADSCPGVCDKPECHKTMVVIEKNSASTENAVIKHDNENMKQLIDALVADKLIEKDNFKLAINEGKLSLNDVAQSEEVNKKYASLISTLGNNEIVMKNK
jgi:K(+)-stimulated pyrophosphate-energized sodium pump